MPISTTTGDDMSSGNTFLNQEGWFHLVVTDATDTPTKKGGELISGALFRVDCTVVAGTAPGCEDKKTDIVIFRPNPAHSDGGKMSRRIQDRALLAMNVIRADQKSSDIEFEVDRLVGQQFIAHLKKGGKDDKYLELAYADIFHVDDPDVKEQPKHAEVLKLIKPEDRRVGDRPPAKPASDPGVRAKQEPLNLDDVDI